MNTDFENEDEFSEAVIAEAVAAEIARLKGKELTYIPNPERIMQFEKALRYAQRLKNRTENITVSHKMLTSTGSAAYISIVFDGVMSVTDVSDFTNIMKLATNTEMVPKLNGSMEINFTFHHLMHREESDI